MPVIQPIAILRVPDHAPLGKIHVQGTIRATRTHVAYDVPDMLGPNGLQLDHPTLDAAVAWIAANPYVPDAQTCPHTHGVYGPVLAMWGNLSILGWVRGRGARFDHGIEPENHTGMTLVAMDPEGRIRALITQTHTGWACVLRDSPEVIGRRRGQFPAALSVFRTTVLDHLYTGSMHGRMQVLHDAPAFDARAIAFQAQRAGWLHALDQSLPDPAPPVPETTVGPTQITRLPDGFCLGELHRDGPLVRAERYGPLGVQDTWAHASLDAAVQWIQASPFAPDLDRFPIHDTIYGPVLWDLPHCTVVGQVWDSTDRPEALIVVVDRTQNVIITRHITGTLAFRATRGDIVAVLSGPSGNKTAVHATWNEALIWMGTEIIAHRHPPHRHADLRAEMPAAVERMAAFLDRRPQLVQEFLQGRTKGAEA